MRYILKNSRIFLDKKKKKIVFQPFKKSLISFVLKIIVLYQSISFSLNERTKSNFLKATNEMGGSQTTNSPISISMQGHLNYAYSPFSSYWIMKQNSLISNLLMGGCLPWISSLRMIRVMYRYLINCLFILNLSVNCTDLLNKVVKKDEKKF